MKLSELLSYLIDKAAELNPDLDDIIGSELEVDPDVRIAMQPTWPMESSVLHVRSVGSNEENIADIKKILNTERLTESERGEATEELDRLREENEVRLYIVEGSHIGYADATLWYQED